MEPGDPALYFLAFMARPNRRKVPRSSGHSERATEDTILDKWLSLGQSVLSESIRIKIRDLTPRQVLYVACPTCDVAAGQRCIRYSGGLRVEPHLCRKWSAVEAMKMKLSLI
jgi:hypothetical protein